MKKMLLLISLILFIASCCVQKKAVIPYTPDPKEGEMEALTWKTPEKETITFYANGTVAVEYQGRYDMVTETYQANDYRCFELRVGEPATFDCIHSVKRVDYLLKKAIAKTEIDDNLVTITAKTKTEQENFALMTTIYNKKIIYRIKYIP